MFNLQNFIKANGKYSRTPPQILDQVWKIVNEANAKKEDSEQVKQQEVNKCSINDQEIKQNGNRRKLEVDDDDESGSKGKKQKLDNDCNGKENFDLDKSNGRLNDTLEILPSEASTASTASPFKWKVAINKILKTAPEDGIKIKKFKKLVSSEYYLSCGEGYSKPKNEVEALINGKLQRRNDKYVIVNDRVKLRKHVS